MTGSPWAWGIFALYLAGTAVLAWRGGRRTGGAAHFAIGSGHMNPWMAGITLGACLASSSLFAIMPGWVYTDGLPALMGFTLPLIAGLATGLWLFAPRFQSIGSKAGALTVPHWLGARYRSNGLRRLFAGLNVLQVAYLVLVVVGCSNVMEAALGIPNEAAVLVIVGFVFGYTGLGGAWAHALTNSMQGTVMLVMALVIFASGFEWWLDGSLWRELGATGTVAPGSVLFSTPGEIWIVQFLMAFGLATQPHLLTKALYVGNRRDLGITIGAGMGTFAIYTLVLFAGAYARLALPEGIPTDKVVGRYLAEAFPWEPLGALVSVAILAASMSTLDGLLVALSATLGGDLLAGRPAVRTNRLVLLGLAALTIAISLDPPELVLVFSQTGVFALVVASAGPLIAGISLQGALSPIAATASALAALAVHVGLLLCGFQNPCLTASIALGVGIAVALLACRLAPARVEYGHDV